MLAILRLLTLSAVLSISHLASAYADLEKFKYLAAVDEEVNFSSPDETTVLKVNQDKDSRAKRNRPGPQQRSQGSFMTYIKDTYPASHRVYGRMPAHYQNQVYANYQIHRDIDQSRKEMLKLLRNK